MFSELLKSKSFKFSAGQTVLIRWLTVRCAGTSGSHHSFVFSMNAGFDDENGKHLVDLPGHYGLYAQILRRMRRKRTIMCTIIHRIVRITHTTNPLHLAQPLLDHRNRNPLLRARGAKRRQTLVQTLALALVLATRTVAVAVAAAAVDSRHQAVAAYLQRASAMQASLAIRASSRSIRRSFSQIRAPNTRRRQQQSASSPHPHPRSSVAATACVGRSLQEESGANIS